MLRLHFGAIFPQKISNLISFFKRSRVLEWNRKVHPLVICFKNYLEKSFTIYIVGPSDLQDHLKVIWLSEDFVPLVMQNSVGLFRGYRRSTEKFNFILVCWNSFANTVSFEKKYLVWRTYHWVIKQLLSLKLILKIRFISCLIVFFYFQRREIINIWLLIKILSLFIWSKKENLKWKYDYFKL